MKGFSSPTAYKPQIFCDLDDVLTNFEGSASAAIGISISKCSVFTLWTLLKDKYSFFETLPWSAGLYLIFLKDFEYLLVFTSVPLNIGCQLFPGYRWPRALGGNQAVQSSNIVWRTSRRLG